MKMVSGQIKNAWRRPTDSSTTLTWRVFGEHRTNCEVVGAERSSDLKESSSPAFSLGSWWRLRDMPTTVRAAFAEIASRLEPTDVQRSDAATKRTGVRDCLDTILSVKSAFLTGSYGRRTIIRPPKDIDLLVVLDYSKHGADYYGRG